jgi:hypothetical protein
MNENIERVIDELDVFRAAEEMTYAAYSRLYDSIIELDDLLKVQAPRVMTLEELKNNVDNPCWFESHGTYMGRKGFWIIPYMFSVTGMMSYVFPLMQTDERGNTHYSELGTYVYGKVWRCWTSRPTDEQMKEVKWDENNRP